MKRLKAIAFLALQFNLHWLRRLKTVLVGPRRQLSVFKKHYEGEGLGHYTQQDREVLNGLSRCLACGWCEGQLAAFRVPGAESHPSPATLALALTNDPSDLVHLRRWNETLSAIPWEQVRCPFRVPLAQGQALLARLATAPTR